ncbi:heterokaryon incompatibility protein-domain-containing protein [Colletotrichum acutatum]|uniref:Heterokaryon incompatibility protein-domain-containing protein n=1 Tax=Glomerella acutata TaxID=27357 RepID=A0AAD8UIZ5_GLOAC|nr:heterokaryon incompatibility protein-domain-containing protein [Colletotrichum acutatum]KAK1719316.1 heterokaryon incompatibility protein-domain-containing protein [Colletotrichum acutatum]
MWLINVNTFELEDFIEPDFPYAILSHTWGSEEVSFRELKYQRDDNVWRKACYLKIYNTCRVAKSLDLGYVWVDTCCIDKTSSAELSEAINSMFRWYNRSWVCFAYLSDMDDLSSSATFLESLADSRWFIRGWTLQELLAPKVVTFYNASWQLLGSKETLSTLLSSITGIDEAILIGKAPLLKIPVATRMSWASKRQTTRIEDSAYCLLGIFGINMPLLYGEGEKAFARLQSEILQETNDLSLLAWTSTVSDPERREEYSGLLAKSPSDFLVCSKIKLVSRPRLSEDPEVGVTRTKVSIKTVLCYCDRFEEEIVSRGEAEYIMQLYHSFIDPQLLGPMSSSPYNGGGWISVGIMIAKTPSGFVRHRPWTLVAEHGSLLVRRSQRSASLPEIAELTMDSYDERAKPLKLVRHLTSEAALELQDIRLRNSIFISVDTRPMGGTPVEILGAEPKALWDGLNRTFLDKVKEESVHRIYDARFLHFSLHSSEKVLLVTAFARQTSSRPHERYAALLNYHDDEMGRWIIDRLDDEWDENSMPYAGVINMLNMVIEGHHETGPRWWPSVSLCPAEYFATSTTPATRNIRLSDGREQELTVSIIPHEAAEGACEIIVSFNR